MIDKTNKIIRALVIIMLLTSITLSIINHAKNNKLRDKQIAQTEEFHSTGERLKELIIKEEVAVKELEEKEKELNQLIKQHKEKYNIE